MQLVSDLISDYEIDCELGSGNSLTAKRSHSDEIEEEVAHLNAVYGYDQISFIEMKDIEDYTSAQGFYGASYDRGAKHLHPLKYAPACVPPHCRRGYIYLKKPQRSNMKRRATGLL